MNSPTTPVVSVITAVLNAAPTLERTIKSVIDQELGCLEYVIIDGGSTDGSLDIIRQYASRIDYWRSEPDEGLYDAMAKGVRVASGRWLLFLGGDDVLVGDLRGIVAMLKDERTVYYGDVFMPRRGLLYDGRFSAYKIMLKNICQQAIFYPRSVFELHSFDRRYRLWADHALNIALFGDKTFRFEYIGKQVCVFNDSSGATSHAEDEVFKVDRASLIKAHLPRYLFILYLLRIGAARLKQWSLKSIRPSRSRS